MARFEQTAGLFSFNLTILLKKRMLLCMKKYFAFLIIAFLTACTQVGDKQTNTILTLAKPAGLSTLQGKTPEEIIAILGEPALIRTEKPHQTFAYKAPDCALFVFFNDDGLSCYTETKGSCDKHVARQILAQKQHVL